MDIFSSNMSGTSWGTMPTPRNRVGNPTGNPNTPSYGPGGNFNSSYYYGGNGDPGDPGDNGGPFGSGGGNGGGGGSNPPSGPGHNYFGGGNGGSPSGGGDGGGGGHGQNHVPRYDSPKIFTMRPNMDLFPELSNDAKFAVWWDKFVAVCHGTGMSNCIDSQWRAANQFQADDFAARNRWMYAILKDKVSTIEGMHILRRFRDSADGRADLIGITPRTPQQHVWLRRI